MPTTKPMITEAALVAAVREQARLHPDRVYRSTDENPCTYVPNTLNEFGCPLGEALAACGMTRQELDELINTTADDSDSGTGGWCDEAVISHLTGRVEAGALASTWLTYVQIASDDGVPWATTVRRADAAWPSAEVPA